jgi:hypothetical protein
MTETQLPEKTRRLSLFKGKNRWRLLTSRFTTITEGRGKIATLYFTICSLLISTQHYFTSNMGVFNFDESGDNIVEDYTVSRTKTFKG